MLDRSELERAVRARRKGGENAAEPPSKKPTATANPSDDIEKKGITQLISLAKSLNVNTKGKLDKSELIAAIRAAINFEEAKKTAHFEVPNPGLRHPPPEKLKPKPVRLEDR